KATEAALLAADGVHARPAQVPDDAVGARAVAAVEARDDRAAGIGDLDFNRRRFFLLLGLQRLPAGEGHVGAGAIEALLTLFALLPRRAICAAQVIRD